MKIQFYKSDWIGIVIGIVMGACQPFFLMDSQGFFKDESVLNQVILQAVIFGLIAPPIVALLNKFIIKKTSYFLKKLSKHVNFMFMTIAFGITAGIVGWTYHFIVGLPKPELLQIAFFGSAGFGFWGAYLIHPQMV